MESDASGDPGEEEVDTYETLAQKAKDLMRKKLPGYVVDSLVAAGFDTLETISDMDISSKQDNSLQLIEEFVSSEYPNDPRFSRGVTASGSFKFPPGHRQSIEKFIKDIREQRKERESRKRERERVCTVAKRKRSTRACTSVPSCTDSSSASPCGGQETASQMLGNIRQQVVKWQRSQKNEKVAHLKEYEQYEACVKVNTKGDDYVASITCKVCGKSYVLGQKEGRPVISNWTKHVSKCIAKPKSLATAKLQNYFPPSVLPENSLPSTSDLSLHSYSSTGEGSHDVRQIERIDLEPVAGIVEDEQHFRLSPPT